MIYILSTKHGIGLELWGTRVDLHTLYEVFGKYWSNEDSIQIKGDENRDKLISGFVHEIRKSYEGQRLKRESSHYLYDNAEYFGTQISWVHFLFSLTAIKYNMRYRETSKFEISMILQIEYWLERAMNNYDAIGAKQLTGFIEDGIYAANEYIYHYMRNINLDYFLLGGGKKSFRKLPDLLKRGMLHTDEYKAYRQYLEADAKKLNCTVDELELDDDDVDYDIEKW